MSRLSKMFNSALKKSNLHVRIWSLRSSNLSPKIMLCIANLLGQALLVSYLILPSNAVADDSQDRLIEKLSRIQISLPATDASRLPITLRLADLYAERGRQASLVELDKGCSDCKAGRGDRLKAIGLYDEVISQLPAEQQGRVQVQMAHMYQLMNQDSKAVSIYESVIKANTSAKAVAESFLTLAEISFKKHQFAEAIRLYSEVIKMPEAENKGLASYRRAWSNYNLGKKAEAVAEARHILNTPALLTRNAAGVTNVDVQFQEEVSRDFATFLVGTGKGGVEEAKELYNVSPEKAKTSNVGFYAKELERLGQNEAAIQVWRFLLQHEGNPYVKLEGYVLLSDMEKGQKNIEQSQKDYRTALQLWPNVEECKNVDRCAELKLRLRKFATDWNRIEKTNPSEQLFESYQDFLRAFPAEKDMTIWAAQVAQLQKKPKEAIELYQTALNLLSTEGASGKTSDKKKIDTEKEALLLSLIEVVETTTDNNLKLSIYDQYLQQSAEKPKALEVRYQKAHILYEAQNYKEAAPALKELALTRGGDSKIKLQAAELALDALVILKQDDELENWAKQFAAEFRQKAPEFNKIVRTAQMNRAAELEKSGRSQDAWSEIKKIEISQAEPEQKIVFYKNKIILAEKLHQIGDARMATENLLQQPNLSTEDRQFALSKKAWYAELVLDFKTAFEATQKVEDIKLTQENKALRLAILAELSGQNPTPYYKQFVAQTKDVERAAAVAAKLVKESANPRVELKAQLKSLSLQPEILSQVVLDMFAKNPSVENANYFLKEKEVASTSAAKVLRRYVMLDQMEKASEKLSTHTIRSEKQNLMANDLKLRIKLLEDFEKLTGSAIDSGDWTTQVVAFEILGRESKRFYNDLMGLPLPDGLNEQEQQEYMTLLSQQASPHQLKAKDLEAKANEFWNQKESLSQLGQTFKGSYGSLRTINLDEIKTLAKYAPPEQKVKLDEILSSPEMEKSVPQLAQIEDAKNKVRENPLKLEPLNELIAIEKQLGQNEMVGYLEARREIIKTSQDASPKDSQNSEGVVQ